MTAVSTAPAAPLPLSGSATSRRFAWRLYAYQITRRSGKFAGTAPARPRRVCVYAPYPEAALAGAGVGKDETSRVVAVRPWEHYRGMRRPQREEVADFYDTVGNALLTGGGMTLALNMAARMSRSPMMRGIIGALHDMVTHGEDLHVAMRRFPKVFTTMQLAMVEASAATGLDRAGGLLITLSHRLQNEGKLWRKFASALAYPFSLLLLTIAGSIVLEVWALPPMVELFHTLGGNLPPITKGFYAVAQFIHHHANVLVPLSAMAIAAIIVAGRKAIHTRIAQQFATRVMLVGPIVQWLALSRALGTFILLKQSGAKVRDQFAMAAAASGNCVVGDFFNACYARIAIGESVEEAFTAERHRLRDDGIRIAGKMEVGMAGADLSALINRIIEELNERTEARLNVLPNAIRWPLLVVCCALIGTVALAIVLPYPNLIADVAHQQAQGVGK
jgi:type II secretory pathway component PulF